MDSIKERMNFFENGFLGVVAKSNSIETTGFDFSLISMRKHVDCLDMNVVRTSFSF